MTAHDPMCPLAEKPTELQSWGFMASECRCDEYARVRADERERIVAELEGPARESEAMYAHAEAVAAKLVEVICEQDDLIQIVGVDATNHRAAAADMRRERAAARAEVAALQVFAQDANEAFASGRREMLADLRAKVEGLEHGQEECWSVYGGGAACDCTRGAVLALIEEANRG